MKEGYADFLIILNDHKKIIQNHIETCIKLQVTSNADKKINNAKSLISQLEIISSMLRDKTPDWVKEILDISRRYVNNPADETGFSYLVKLFDVKKTLENFEWTDDGINIEINFEKIYEKFKAESKVDQYFDDLLNHIEMIIQLEGVINSNIELKLKKLASLIKTNRNKSLYADESLIKYVLLFIKEFAINLAKNIPGLGELIDALMKTLDKLESDINSCKENSIKEITTKIQIPNTILLYDSKSIRNEISDNLGQIISIKA